MKNVFILFSVILYAGSCSCEGDDPIVGPHYGIGPSFRIVDHNGNDLLNPDHPNFIHIEDIEVFFLVQGELKSPYEVLSMPLGSSIVDTLCIRQNGGQYYKMSIIFNPIPSSGNIAVTYVKWNENDTDTIESRVNEKGAGYGNYMISYNGEPWNPDPSTDGEFKYIYTITKMK